MIGGWSVFDERGVAVLRRVVWLSEYGLMTTVVNDISGGEGIENKQ